MTNSKAIARIVGPVLVVVAATEAFHLDIFAGIPAAFVYLNGMLLFAAGTAIVQAHNRWTRDWTVVVTVLGWLLVAGGLFRMIAPGAPQASPGLATNAFLAVLVLAGAILSVQGYRRGD